MNVIVSPLNEAVVNMLILVVCNLPLVPTPKILGLASVPDVMPVPETRTSSSAPMLMEFSEDMSILVDISI